MSETGLAVAVLWALNERRKETSNDTLARYLAQDLHMLKAEQLLSRAWDREQNQAIEQRLDRLEQALLVLTSRLAHKEEQESQLWQAIRELARRLDGRDCRQLT